MQGGTVRILKLTEEECFAVLQRVELARLACACDGQPYIIPVYLVLHEMFLYGFTTPGQKIGWMRGNPKVCLEWDEVVSPVEWISVVAFGEYEELADTPERAAEWQFAYELLQNKRSVWWQPGVPSSEFRGGLDLPPAVYFRIRIGPMTGRRATE
jgi:nitroimidazol reductase NimA-like FMN-containing flavoprotein (pyridoxamine 5'-phosphate oxidase superfamily)